MAADVSTIETERLRLRCWRHADRDAFAAMNADPAVMADLGGPLGRADSDRKYDHYLAVLDRFGFSRWAIEDPDGEFLGYAGVMPRRGKHPLGDHDEIGWRLVRSAWGKGLASEAARAALDDAFLRLGLDRVLAYTAADNPRSQAVMKRLSMERDASLDFSQTGSAGKAWRGLVWIARRSL